MDRLLQDCKYSIKQIVANKTLTTTLVLTAALCIGANTAVFSLLNTTLRSPSQFRDYNRIVSVSTTSPLHPEADELVSVPEYLAWKDKSSRVFDGVGAMLPVSSTLGATLTGDPAERLLGQLFSASLFRVIGVQPLFGRTFSESENQVGAQSAPVVVISFHLWQTRFGSDPHVIGRNVLLDGVATEIIGVMPQKFTFFQENTDFWRPMTITPLQLKTSTRFRSVFAHLQEGVTLQRAQSEMDRIAEDVATLYPDWNKGWGVRVRLLDDTYFAGLRQMLLILQGAVAFILVIACANVAGLLLIRTTARQKEIAIRCSIGATRLDIIRPFIIESLLTALSGGVFGCFLAWIGMRALLASSPAWLSRLTDFHIDGRVLLFATAVTVSTGLLFGSIPALHSWRHDLLSVLNQSTRGASGDRFHRRLQAALVVIQFGLTLVLAIGAGLVIMDFILLQRANLGAEIKGVLSFQSRLAGSYLKQTGIQDGYPQLQVSPIPAQFFERVATRLREIPGVQAAAGISQTPFKGEQMQVTFSVDGRSLDDPTTALNDSALSVSYYLVTPGYFSTMQIPLIKGRDFNAHDTEKSPWGIVINRAMRDRFWPGENPLGKRIIIKTVPEEQPREIIGLVGDTPTSRWDHSGGPIAYASVLQQPPSYRVPYGQDRIQMTFVARLRYGTQAMIPTLRKAVAEVNPSIPVSQVETIEQYLGEEAAIPRYYMIILSVFGGIGLLLSVLGVYGIVAFSVSQRSREIGIRIALGATPIRVKLLVLRQVSILVCSGLLLGFMASLILTRFLTPILWGTGPREPMIFLGVSSLLALTAFAASLVPASRAARTDPRMIIGEQNTGA